MELRLTLPPVADMELVAVRAADVVGRAIGLDRDQIEAVGVAVAEAFLNAVEHGGGREVEVRVLEECWKDGSRALVVEVEDRGPGFDPERGPKRRPMGRLKRRGWGLRLMRELVDELQVESQPGRTVVRLCKRREADG
ncbi:MAG: ATP-binding protein [Nitrospirae bacterium]|nr:MAG: ATP-binding protein [Nitrospirota bacterium]